MRLPVLFCWGFALCLSGKAAVAQGQSPPPAAPPVVEGISAIRLERLHGLLQSTIDAGHYLGAVSLIARNGKIVDQQTFGHRDLARTAPMATDSIFRIYSMTKTVASVAALLLMEEGKLALDDPVGRIIPEFARMEVLIGGTVGAPQLRPAKRPITIRHLLTHTAGFATHDAKGDVAVARFNRFDLHQSPTLAAYADYVAHQALALDPGEEFWYDGVSIEVLSRVIEVVSGMPFDTFLRQRVLAPMKMNDTDFRVPPEKRGRIADMVTTNAEGHLVIAATRDASRPGESLNPYPSGAGGLYSTARDYLRFCQMLLNGGSLDGVSILGRKSVDLMMSNQLAGARLPEGALVPGETFGLGGYVVADAARRGRLGSPGQFGWSGAGSTYYTIDREEKLIAILLMQHLPQGLPKDPPKMSARFYNAVYQSLVDAPARMQK